MMPQSLESPQKNRCGSDCQRRIQGAGENIHEEMAAMEWCGEKHQSIEDKAGVSEIGNVPERPGEQHRIGGMEAGKRNEPSRRKARDVQN